MRDDTHPALEALARFRLDASSEASLQLAIAQALDESALSYEREVRLDARSRIDFLLPDGLGIEVKVDGSQTEVLRQLVRYADHEQVRALALFTTRSRHLSGMPSTLRGKPLTVRFQGGL